MRFTALLLLCACRSAGPSVLRAEEIGVVPQSELIEGRDGGGSAWVFDRSVWTYGDTVLRIADDYGSNWHHNSVSITLDAEADDGLDGFTEPLEASGAPRHFIPPTESELAFNLAHLSDESGACAESPCGARWAVWPGTPMWDEAGARALIFYGLIYGEPGHFEGVGQSLAVWTDPETDPERPILSLGAEHPELLWGPGDDFPVATALIHEGTLYAYPCFEGGWDHDCHIARAPVDLALERGAWEWYDGEGWSPDRDDSVSLFPGDPIQSIAWNTHLNAWLMVSSHPLEADICARTAPDPWGPWSDESLVYTTQDGDHNPYDVVAHPDLEEDGGRVQYLTWSRPTSGWFGTEQALLRVELY